MKHTKMLLLAVVAGAGVAHAGEADGAKALAAQGPKTAVELFEAAKISFEEAQETHGAALDSYAKAQRVSQTAAAELKAEEETAADLKRQLEALVKSLKAAKKTAAQAGVTANQKRLLAIDTLKAVTATNEQRKEARRKAREAARKANEALERQNAEEAMRAEQSLVASYAPAFAGGFVPIPLITEGYLSTDDEANDSGDEEEVTTTV